MVKITDYKGNIHYVATHNISRISDSSTSGKWHGIHSIVKLKDGMTIESGEGADIISKRVVEEEGYGE